MPKLASPLTVNVLNAFEKSPIRPRELRDGACLGLIARVEKSGKVRFHHVSKAGRRVIGTYPVMTLVMAREKVKSGLIEKPSILLLSDVISHYETALRATRSEKQVKQNMTNLNAVVWGELLTVPVGKLTHPKLNTWLEKRIAASSKTTAKRNLNSLRAAMNLAVKDGLISSNPLEGYGFKVSANRRTRILSPEEKGRLVKAALEGNSAIGCLAMLCLYAGLRRGEALKLRWSDIDLAQGLLNIRGEHSKVGKGRTIPLHAVARKALERLPSREGAVFPGRKGCEYMSEPKKGWFALRDRAGLPEDVVLYNLRHSCASALLESGTDIESVRAILGHTSVSTTSVYLHTTALRLKDAIGRL